MKEYKYEGRTAVELRNARKEALKLKETTKHKKPVILPKGFSYEFKKKNNLK